VVVTGLTRVLSSMLVRSGRLTGAHKRGALSIAPRAGRVPGETIAKQ
jgi:hypothetical protein